MSEEQEVMGDCPPAVIPWGLGATDKTYGVCVWIARIENLDAHFRIIADYLPEDADWLRGQVASAREQAAGYVRDYAPTAAISPPLSSASDPS